MITGTRIAQARKAAGMTQQAMADIIGVHAQTLGGWERSGDCPVNAKTAEAGEALATALEALEQKAAITSADLTDRDHCIPSPYDYWHYISRGDLLLLASDRAEDGDIIIAYTDTGEPEWIGRVMHATSAKTSPLIASDQQAKAHRLPPRDRYRVVDLAVHRHRDRRTEASYPDNIPPEFVYFSPEDDFDLGDD